VAADGMSWDLRDDLTFVFTPSEHARVMDAELIQRGSWSIGDFNPEDGLNEIARESGRKVVVTHGDSAPLSMVWGLSDGPTAWLMMANQQFARRDRGSSCTVL